MNGPARQEPADQQPAATGAADPTGAGPSPPAGIPAPGPERPRPPRWLLLSGDVAFRVLAVAVVIWLLAEFAARITLLLVAVFVALLLAGVFSPLVRWGVRKGASRLVGAAASVAIVLLLVTGAVAGIGERIEHQLPELREQVRTASQQLSQTLGIEIPTFGSGGSEGSSGATSGEGGSGGATSGSGDTGGSQAGSGQGGSSSGGAGSGSSLSSSMLGHVVSSVRIVFDLLIGLFLTVAFMFLFLKNGPGMWEWALGKLGGRVRDDAEAAGRAAWATVGSYVRGLTVVAAVDAVGVGVGLLLLGVPLALTLAALQFIASYIPTIGALVAGALAVAVGFASGGPSTALFVLVLVIVVQQIGNDVVEPYVMGRSLPINGFVVLAAVTAGGLLWGIAGALLFVPLTAAVTAAAKELWERHGRPPIAGTS